MTDAEKRALEQIAKLTDTVRLRKMIVNAKGRSPMVEKAAFRRLVAISAEFEPGTIQHQCWSMVHTVEELRRLSGRKVSRMNRMRPKIEADGEVAALEYCALHKTDGFDEVLEYGMPELTAEAIVLANPEHFSDAARNAARSRLQNAGIPVDPNGSLLA